MGTNPVKVAAAGGAAAGDTAASGAAAGGAADDTAADKGGKREDAGLTAVLPAAARAAAPLAAAQRPIRQRPIRNPSSPSPHFLGELKVGLCVNVRYRGGPTAFPGRIAAVGRGGESADIEYDDGDKEKGVGRAFIVTAIGSAEGAEGASAPQASTKKRRRKETDSAKQGQEADSAKQGQEQVGKRAQVKQGSEEKSGRLAWNHFQKTARSWLEGSGRIPVRPVVKVERSAKERSRELTEYNALLQRLVTAGWRELSKEQKAQWGDESNTGPLPPSWIISSGWLPGAEPPGWELERGPEGGLCDGGAHSVAQVEAEVSTQVQAQVEAEVRAQVQAQVEAQLQAQIRAQQAQVQAQVQSQVQSQVQAQQAQL